MSSLLRPSLSTLLAVVIVSVEVIEILAWNPRFPSASCRGSSILSGLRTSSGNDDAGNRRMVLLSAARNAAHNGGDTLDDDSDLIPNDRHHGQDDHHNDQPLYAEGNEIHEYMISRLEAMFDIDVEADFFKDDTDGKPQRLLEGGERVVLGDWMEWEEGPCYGDSCGDDLDQCDIPEEYKVAAPKVDVMSFLGIRRAEPLKVQRDWD